MTVSLTTHPDYPIPGQPCEVTFAVDTAATYVKAFCTAAPDGSPERQKLDAMGLTEKRIKLYEGPVADKWMFRPQVGGVYMLTTEEYSIGASVHGGAYLDDPDSWPSESILATTTSLQLTICSRMTAQIGVPPDVATLVCYVHGWYIRQTFLGVQGVATPALTEPQTGRAKAAVDTTTVVAALEALPNELVYNALGSPPAVLNTLIGAFNAHRTQGGVHNANDAVNVVADSFGYNVQNPNGVARAANELLLRLTRHMHNDDDGAGIGTAAYHQPGGTAHADMENTIIASSASEQDPLTQLRLIADLHRAYEAHRVDTSYHTAADSTNLGGTIKELPTLFSAFNAQIQQGSPTAPATANAGAVRLVHSAGFKEG